TFSDNLYKLGRITCIRFAEIYADKGMHEQAESFLELGRKYIENIDTEILKLEYDYVDALISQGEEKLQKLISLTIHANSIENNGIKCSIYRAAADEYASRGNNQEALKYYISALNFLRKLVHNVPDEYKIRFVTSHNRNAIKEGLIKTSELLTSEQNVKHGSKDIKKLSQKPQKINLKSIDKYFDYTDYVDIYRYKEVDEIGKGAAVDISTYNKFLYKLQELVSRFTEDNISNLKNVINMFAEITQAKNAFIAMLDEDDNLNVLASYNRYFEIPFYKYIIEQVKQKKDSIIVTDAFEYNRKKGDILIPKDMTAVFCIPIMGSREEDSMQLFEDKRRSKGQTGNHVIGYIYMDTDSIINNFTEETSHFCMMASKIAYVLADNYSLRIVSAVDKLTKLYTRKYFEVAIMNEITYSEKEGGEFSVIMIDIDKFKTVNDRFGHQKGDEILQNVSSIIMGTVRKGDICARYGGEEIIILLPGTKAEGGYHVAEKLRRKVENAKLLGLHNPLTISLGVSSYPEHSTWVKDLIEKADQALYYAKESGRNMSCIYQPNMSKSVKRVDKLAGIISGNLVEDQRRVETMLEILELQRSSDISFKDKIFKFLGRIIEVSEAQTGIIFHLNGEQEIESSIARKKFTDTEIKEVYYSEGIVKKCIESRMGEYMIDWGNYPGIDSVTGMPDWQSIIVIPLTKAGILKGLLYLSVSVKNKEFDASAFNFIKTLCDIIAAIY
ncbi:MAG: sensor domain-containing diguanylate cyclase, partial [Nitrospirota bacterium]